MGTATIVGPAGYPEFVVKNVAFGPKHESPPKGSAKDIYLLSEAQWPPGLPGQGVATPGPPLKKGVQPIPAGSFAWLYVGKIFANHKLAYRDTNGNGKRDAGATPEKIYDPSYGIGDYGTLLEWKTLAIGAFVRHIQEKNGTITRWLAEPVTGQLEIIPLVDFDLP